MAIGCERRQSRTAERASSIKSRQVPPPLSMSALLSALQQQVRRLALLALSVVLCFSLSACGEGKAKAATLSADDVAAIERQATGFLAARDRLPELAALVKDKDWTFTRNLIHGPMQEVSREMLYINQRLLPVDQAEATKLANQLKSALAQLDEAARLQDGEKLRKAYIAVASGFGKYAQILPAQVQEDLKQI
jgi:photosystem II protein PsbQ